MTRLLRSGVVFVLSCLCLAATLPASAQGSGIAVLREGFEQWGVGPWSEQESSSGRWLTSAGHAQVDGAHHHSGARCLHLTGGEGRTVVWELPLEASGAGWGQLSFWAERWTRREPFSFQVEGRLSGAWVNLDATGAENLEVGVGSFPTRVQLRLEQPFDALRFRCTAAEGGGLLLDDFELTPRGPKVVEALQVLRPVLPCLVGNAVNPIVGLRVDVAGTDGELAIESLKINLAGTSRLEDVRAVQIFGTGSQGAFSHARPNEIFAEASRFGSLQDPKLRVLSDEVIFEGRQVLAPGANHFWLSVELKPDANIDGRVGAGFETVRLSNGVESAPKQLAAPVAQRMGVAVRNAGQDGAEVYRIPGLTTTNRGGLIAVYDVRWQGWGDLPGHIDVGMRRSIDGGRTWQAQQVIMDMGSDPEWNYDGVGDPAVLVDRETNTIWVAAVWHHGNLGWHRSGPGLEPEQTGQLMLVRSEDDGVTWSAPISITRSVKDPKWSHLLVGPGRGICMSDGTLVFAAQYQDSPERERMPYSTLLSSRDHGETWQIGTGAKPNTTEAQVVELEAGLMLNMRDNRNNGGGPGGGGSRSVYMTTDLGDTWQAHSTSRKVLAEPVCMASLLHVGHELDGQLAGTHANRLLFSNPAVPRAPRRNMTLQASDDAGLTWPRSLLLDEGTSAGYSCLTMIDARTVGILYEGSRAHMTFQRIPLAELLP